MDKFFQDALDKGLISVEKPRLQVISTRLIRDLGFWLGYDCQCVSPGILDDTMYYTAKIKRYNN